MQRFRRSRNESKKRKDHLQQDQEGRLSSSGRSSRSRHSTATTATDEHPITALVGMTRSTSASSSLVLPEPEEFRTSLILPHLTARFELLRGTDGQLVDYDTLTTQLDEQRKTGRLTTFEMDAVLKRYKLESAAHSAYPGGGGAPASSSSSSSVPTTNKKKKKERIDWSGIDLERLTATEKGRGGGGGGGQEEDGTAKKALFAVVPRPSPDIRTSAVDGGGVVTSSSFLSPPQDNSLAAAAAVGGSPTSSRTSFVSFLPTSSASSVVTTSSPPLPPPPTRRRMRHDEPQHFANLERATTTSSSSDESHPPRASFSSIREPEAPLSSPPRARPGRGQEESTGSSSVIALSSGGRVALGTDDDVDDDEDEVEDEDEDEDDGSFRGGAKEETASPSATMGGSVASTGGQGQGTTTRFSRSLENERSVVTTTMPCFETETLPPTTTTTNDDNDEVGGGSGGTGTETGAGMRLGARTTGEAEGEGTSWGEQDAGLDLVASGIAQNVVGRGLSPVSSETTGVSSRVEQERKQERGPGQMGATDDGIEREPALTIEGGDAAMERDRKPFGEDSRGNATEQPQTASSATTTLATNDDSTSFESDSEVVDPFYSRPLPASGSASAAIAPDAGAKVSQSRVSVDSDALSIRSERSTSVPRSPQRRRRNSNPCEEETRQPNERTRLTMPPPRSTSDEEPGPEFDLFRPEREREGTGQTDATEMPATPPALLADAVERPGSTTVIARVVGEESGKEADGQDLHADIEEEAHDRDLTVLAASIPLPRRRNASDSSIISTTTTTMSTTGEGRSRGRGHERESLVSSVSSSRGSTGGGSSFHEALEEAPVHAVDADSGGVHSPARDPGQSLSDDEFEPSDEQLFDQSRHGQAQPVRRSVEPLSADQTLSSSSVPASPAEHLDRSGVSTDFDRLPPHELLAIATSSPSFPSLSPQLSTGTRSGGRDDLVLSDLVVIQEALVRRAEEKHRRGPSTVGFTSGTTRSGEEHAVLPPGEMLDDEGGTSQEESEAEPGPVDEEAAEEGIKLGREGRGSGDDPIGLSPDDGYDDGDDVDSSIDTGGMSSRKDSVESGITSTGAFDFGDELAGLGFSSLPTPSSASSRRMSKKRESARSAESTTTSPPPPIYLGVAGSGPTSTAMELGTSQSSSSPNFTTNSAITPSTTQSDAFEFSSLAGSPDVALWTGREEQADAEESEEDEPLSPNLGVSRSPAMLNLSTDGDGLGVVSEEQPDLIQGSSEEAQNYEAEDQIADLAQPASADGESSSLGAPVQLDDDVQPLSRVPRRNMTRRDPASTTSMLIRDVRNQATLATFALKKTPVSPPSRSLSKKSIHKGSISSPRLVQAPADMATVPIVPPMHNTSPSPRAGDGAKSKGLGLRFKRLLKKQSRDQLVLNGDEVTPFVDFRQAEAARPASGPPPVTPPNQNTARFTSPSGSGQGSDFPQTPVGDPTTPLAKPQLAGAASSVRSPPRRPPPPSLEVVEELAERRSPQPSIHSTYPASPVPSTSSAKEEGRGLNRFVSRLRRSPIPPTPSARPVTSPDESSKGSSKSSVGEPASRTSSREEEPSYGLGIESSSVLEGTAPLSVGRNSQASLAMPSGPGSGRAGVSRTSGHPVRASTDSMQRLWEAAEDLGLSPDKVQELVDSAYAQSPTTSHGRTGSVGSSSFAHRSNSTSSPRRQRSSRQGGESTVSYTRHASETSSSHAPARGHRRGRKGSTASSRSVQDRAPTPPPGARHHRKTSLASSLDAGPIPDLPIACSSTSLPPSSSAGSRLSVSGAAQHPPPASPSLGSLRSSRRSGYADSFLDFYAQASDDYDEPDLVPPVPALDRDPSLSFAVMDSHGDSTLRSEASGADLDDEAVGGEVVWQVLSDLRNNRLSTLSKDSSFGFDSRDSSFEVEGGGGGGESSESGAGGGASTDRSESIANMLRHRDRKRSSASMPPFQAGGRFPSIYVRDEQKLLDLGQHGGVAREQQGRFFVRPKAGAVDDADDEGERRGIAPPPLPEQYRQLIATASSSSSMQGPPLRPNMI